MRGKPNNLFLAPENLALKGAFADGQYVNVVQIFAYKPYELLCAAEPTWIFLLIASRLNLKIFW